MINYGHPGKCRLTKCPDIDIVYLILDNKSDPRLLGKIVSLTGVFLCTGPHVEFILLNDFTCRITRLQNADQ